MKVRLRICTASDISKILTNFYEHLGQFNLKEFSNITNGINPKKCLSFHAITYLPHDREARQFALRRTVKINDKLACSQPITVKYYAKLQVMCFSLLSTTFYLVVDKSRNMEHPGTFRNIPEHRIIMIIMRKYVKLNFQRLKRPAIWKRQG